MTSDLKIFRRAVLEDPDRAEEILRTTPGIIEAKSPIGETALHYLVIEDCLNAVRWLIERGADVNTQCDDGDTPLIHAASLGYPRMVELLLAHGAQPNVDGNGTALSRAPDVEIVELLLAAGADPNFAGDRDNPPLHCALRKCRRPVAERLIRAGARLDTLAWFDETPLLAAAGAGEVSTLVWLLELGADLHSRDSSGGTVLHAAAASGHIPMLQHLLSLGLDPTVRREDGETAADLALRMGHKAAADFLNTRSSPPEEGAL